MVRVFTAFSGYDSQCMALDRAGVEYDLVGWSEIDKWAIQAHDAVFPQYKDRNYGDISKIDWNDVPDFDLFTYSSPCQDFSRAGSMMGGVENSGTRSSLLWECRKAIMEKKPKYLILENVSDLVSDTFGVLFRSWEQTLAEMGYNNFCKVVNAKDCGIPQNRERVFLVSILNSSQYFEFPGTKETADINSFLDQDDKVDESYFVDKERLQIIQEVCDELRVNQATKSGWIGVRPGGLFDSNYPSSKHRRGRVQGGGFICPTLTASNSQAILRYVKDESGFRLRRITERECFRLMGVAETDIDKISNSGVSKTRQYRLAGNSIVVDVLCGIFNNLLWGCNKPEDYLF